MPNEKQHAHEEPARKTTGKPDNQEPAAPDLPAPGENPDFGYPGTKPSQDREPG